MSSIVNLLVISEEAKADARYLYLEEAGADDLPVFTIQPEFQYREEQEYSVLKSSFDSGMILRRAVHDAVIRTFRLRWKNATKVTKDRIVEVFRNRGGSGGALWFTPVDGGGLVKVRFKDDTFTWHKRKHGNYQIGFDFIELI